MRDIIRAERKEAEEDEFIVFLPRVADSHTLSQVRRVLIVALPGSEDEQPLEEPRNEFERVSKQGSWKLRDLATAQRSQEASELRVCPVSTRGMQGREKPPAQPAPAEEPIQVVDDLPLAALPLEGRDSMGL